MGEKRERLDVLLVRRGVFPSRERAQAAIMAGEVLVDGLPAAKPGQRVRETARLEVRPGQPYVSRGGIKLARALDAFGIDPRGLVCLDVGASTGGFTDCLLQRGARRVYAVDVGYGQLAWSLRRDPRVVVLERVNARYLSRREVPEPVALAAVDVSFISGLKVLPAVRELLMSGGQVVWLIKPQFEAGPEKVGKRGVVRDPAVHREVLARVLAGAEELGFSVRGLIPSPVRGEEGNIEFLAWLEKGGPPAVDVKTLAARAVEAAHAGDEGGSERGGR